MLISLELEEFVGGASWLTTGIAEEDIGAVMVKGFFAFCSSEELLYFTEISALSLSA